VGEDPVTVRPGDETDIERGLRVWAAAHERRRGRPTPPAHAQRARAHFAKPDAFWVVAQRGDALAGMALGTQALADDGAGPPIPGRCHIAAVFVNPAYWGQGIGGRVIDALLDEAAERGYTTAQLWTAAGNDRALRLYERRGFAPTGRCTQLDDEQVIQLARD
jgi:ribosomal protein S18 acetylase RimI-like enzyme